MDKLSVVGIDLAKRVVSVCRIDMDGAVQSATMARERLLEVAAQWTTSLVAMEACGMSHFYGRALRQLGHQVVIYPAGWVAPYRRGGKNDRNDARAIADCARHCEAAGVPIKTVEQQTELSLHRLREGKKEERTALINRLRGLLLEFGLAFAQGSRGVSEMMRFDLEKVPAALRPELLRQRQWLQLCDAAVEQLSREINALASQRAEHARLQSQPSVGPLTASAVAATIGKGQQFKNARQFAAWVGLTPKQHSTGGKTTLGRITRLGDAHLRTLLIQGARSALQTALAAKSPTRLQAWMVQTSQRIGYHKALVAIANKQARLLWCLLTRQEEYRAEPAQTPPDSATA